MPISKHIGAIFWKTLASVTTFPLVLKLVWNYCFTNEFGSSITFDFRVHIIRKRPHLRWKHCAGSITSHLLSPKVDAKVTVKQSHHRPGQALKVPEGWCSQISKQSALEGDKLVSLTHRPSLPQGNSPGTNFC